MKEKREGRGFKIAAMILGTLVALATGEISIRLSYDFSKEHAPLFLLLNEKGGEIHGANCYPSDPFDHFPLDLRESEQKKAFIGRYTFAVQKDPALSFNRMIDSDLKALNEGVPLEKGIHYLQVHTPHCVTYSLGYQSKRRYIPYGDSQEVAAIIGDSFAMGWGVPDDQTLGAHLAPLLKKNVGNLAEAGSNIKDVYRQFDALMKRAGGKKRLTDIYYIFVLNDPLLSPALKERESRINDFMSIRYSSIGIDKKGMAGLSWWMGEYFQLYRLLRDRWILYEVKKKTLVWYRDIFDPFKNPHLEESYRLIARMAKEAEKKGTAFHLVLYPLFVDLNVYPLEEVHDKIRDGMREGGVTVVDLLPVFQGKKGGNLIVHPLDLHPGGNAHGIAAEKVGLSSSH